MRVMGKERFVYSALSPGSCGSLIYTALMCAPGAGRLEPGEVLTARCIFKHVMHFNTKRENWL